MIKRLCAVLILTCLFAVNYGCATNVMVHQSVPSVYFNQSNIKHCDVSYNADIVVSKRLKRSLEKRFESKINEINDKTADKVIYLAIEINEVNIANKVAAAIAGAFAGNNSLHGTVVAYDFETNKIIARYRVEIDKNYGGYSTFFDLESDMSEEFTNQVLQQVAIIE